MNASVDVRSEQRKIRRNGLLGVLFCAAVLAAGYSLLPLLFPFPQDFEGALKLTLQADLFVALWVLIAVRWVARIRFRSAEDMPGAASARPSPLLAIPAAFLQNSLEQAIIAVAAHVALATLLTGAALALIPTAVLLFSVGRIAFLAGNAKGAGARAFGMVVTSAPTFAAFILAISLVIRGPVGGE